MSKYDLVVIGGGPGGYPAAIRASQLGLRVAIIEERRGFGGECTLYGCIPSKTLIKLADVYRRAVESDFIVGRESIGLDFARLIERVSRVVSTISSGIELLLKSYGVDIVRGRAEFIDPRTVRVSSGETVSASRFIVATGSEPATIRGVEIDGETVLDNRSVFNLKRKPSSMIVVGGGYVGVEISSALAKLGVEISIVEMMPNILPGIDLDASRVIERRLSKLGVKIYKNNTVRDVKISEKRVEVELSGGARLESEKILIAVGRRPRTQNIGLERVGVRTDDKGYIVVDDRLRTSNPSILASGDVAGPPLLAHKAFIQAVVAAENAAGLDSVYSRKAIPMVVFSDPEIAQIGMSLEEAREKGFKAVSVKLPLGGVARSVIDECEDGFIKMIYEEDSKRILGFVIVASHASEIAGEASLIIENNMSIEDVERATHPHPTISEVFKEIIDYVQRRSAHYIIKRKS